MKVTIWESTSNIIIIEENSLKIFLTTKLCETLPRPYYKAEPRAFP